MPDDQPRTFTLFDLFWEVVHVAFVAAGCYIGWQFGGHFFALFAGGLVGRIVGVCLVLGLRSWVTGGREP